MDIDILSKVIGFVAFLFSVVIHENAHGIAANHYGDPTARAMGRITMNPIPHIDPVGSVLIPLVGYLSGGFIFGWAKPVPVNPANLRNPVVHNAYVAAAGPASNLLLALGAALIWIIVGVAFNNIPGLAATADRTLLFFNTLCYNLILINCVLAVFNLLPIPPLDGHWILIRFLPPGPREAVASVGRFGFIILIMLMVSGVLGMVIGPPLRVVVGGYLALVKGVIGLFS